MDSIVGSPFSDERELTEARKNIYSFLSRIFLEKPSQETINSILNKDFLANLPDAKDGNEPHPLKQFAASFNGDIKSLQDEYNILFVIPLKRTYVKPYESVYLTGLMLQEPTNCVKRFYGESGIDISETFPDPADHVGLELEFMKMLCEKEIDSLNEKNTEKTIKYLGLEKSFLEEHLLKWIPALVDEICEKSENYFYRGISIFLRDFIFFDKVQVDDLLTEFK